MEINFVFNQFLKRGNLVYNDKVSKVLQDNSILIKVKGGTFEIEKLNINNNVVHN